MRTFLSFLAVLTLAAASAQADVNVNGIVDALLARLSKNEHITNLPNLEEDAELKLLFWNTTVKIEADDGAPVGGVTLQRFNDAILKEDEDGNLALVAEVGFEEAECGYEYKTQLGKVQGPGGRFTAKIGATTLRAKLTLFLSPKICGVAFDYLNIGALGDITLEGSGSRIANTVYRTLLIDMLKKKRRDVLQSIIDAADDVFPCDNLLPLLLA